jgi:hypothetical protein
MTNEDKQVLDKLEQLMKVMCRNEQRMRETFMKYEELLAQRESLASSIDALLAFRIKMRSNFFVENPEVDIETESRIFANQARQ